MANRFVQYEDDALQELLEGKTSKHTDKATKTSITLLKTFLTGYKGMPVYAA